jgi:phage terminase large subunit
MAKIRLFKYTSPVFTWNLNETAEVVVNQGGTSSGKTFSILQVLITRALAEPNQVITVVGQDIPNLKAGALRDFSTIVYHPDNRVAEFLVDENKTDRVFTFANGSFIEFKSFDNEQDAKSGKRDYLFINEANGVQHGVYEELAVRTRKQIFLDYNPTAAFWVHEHLMDAPGVKMIISNYRHNPFLDEKTIQKIERYRETDENRWRVYGLGLTGRVDGLVFDNCERVPRFPFHTRYYGYGLDFGFTNDPTALVRMAVHDGEIYGEELIYETGLTNRDLINRMNKIGIERNISIYADAAEPKSIAELRRAGFNAIAAKKGADSVRFGIDLLRQKRINITSDSVNWWNEQQNYTWKKRHGDAIEVPVDRNNHCWDAARYWAIMKLTERPKLPPRRMGILQ